jgi:hypothetical protein
MTKKIMLLALCSMLLAPCSATAQQQRGKSFPIGFLESAQ